MSQISALRTSLDTAFTELRSGVLPVDVARELAALARQVIKSVQAELEYAKQRQVVPVIAYLEDAPQRD